MKKTLWTLLLAAATLTACKEDPTPTPTPTPTDPDAVAFKASAQVNIPGSDTPLEYIWAANSDRIGIFALEGETARNTNIYYSAFSSTALSVFTASKNSQILWPDKKTALDFYAYYPYNSQNGDMNAIPVSIPSAQTGKEGGFSHLKKSTVAYASVKDAKQDNGNVEFEFKANAGIIKLDITATYPVIEVSSVTLECADATLAFSAGTLDLADGTVSVDSKTASDKIVFTLEEVISLGEETAKSIYIMVSPGLAGKTLSVSAVIEGENTPIGTVTVPTGGIQAGTLTALDLEYDAPPPPPAAIDLSANGTANTYLVNKPATEYKFKATVRGNGDGSNGNITWYCDDNSRSAPYNTGITPADVKLLWYNTPLDGVTWKNESPVVIESVLLDDEGYAHFRTPETFVNGNVVLAAFDKEVTYENMDGAEILWSWTIWALNDYDYDQTAKKVGGYTIMDRNLGAMAGPETRNVSDEWKATWAIGNYYQFGRKDPFPAAAVYRNDSNIQGTGDTYAMEWGLPTHTPFKQLQNDMSNRTWGDKDILFVDNHQNNSYFANAYSLENAYGLNYSANDAITTTVKYPYRWMSSTLGAQMTVSPHMWVHRAEQINKNVDYEKYYDWLYLWGGMDNEGGEKTIYDPCPPGWRVSTPAAIVTALGDMKTVAPNKQGLYSQTSDLYFPLGGERMAYWNKVNSLTPSASGDFTVKLATTAAGNHFFPIIGRHGGNQNSGQISDNVIGIWQEWTGAGYQVRCVREDVGASATQPKTGPRAALSGDSITQGWSADPTGFLAKNGYMAKGISGWTTWGIMGDFYKNILSHNPQCVVVGGGTNDLAGNDNFGDNYWGYTPIQKTLGNLKTMAEWAAHSGCKVVMSSVFPAHRMGWVETDPNGPWHQIFKPAERIVKLNKLIKEYCQERGFIYVDYHSVLVDPATGGLQSKYTYDDVHLTTAAYAAIEPLLKEAVDRALANPNQTGGSGQLDDIEKWEGWE